MPLAFGKSWPLSFYIRFNEFTTAGVAAVVVERAAVVAIATIATLARIANSDKATIANSDSQ